MKRLLAIATAITLMSCGSDGGSESSETTLSCPVTVITDVTQEQYQELLEEGSEVAVVDYQEIPVKNGDVNVVITVEVCQDVVDQGNETNIGQ